MFFVFGWGKVTKKPVKPMFERTCGYCNRTEIWQLCKNRTWFTLFFIPIIPYSTTYSISCPHCGSYMEVSKEQFLAMENGAPPAVPADAQGTADDGRYAGKTAVQINYLKQMEEFRNKQQS